MISESSQQMLISYSPSLILQRSRILEDKEFEKSPSSVSESKSGCMRWVERAVDNFQEECDGEGKRDEKK